MRQRLAALLVVTLLSRSVTAAEPSSPADAHFDIAPTPDGKGVQMSSETFTLYLKEQIALDGCNLRLDVRDKLLKETAAQVERTWWERHGFWVGLTLGFAGAIALTWGTVKTLSTAK